MGVIMKRSLNQSVAGFHHTIPGKQQKVGDNGGRTDRGTGSASGKREEIIVEPDPGMEPCTFRPAIAHVAAGNRILHYHSDKRVGC